VSCYALHVFVPQQHSSLASPHQDAGSSLVACLDHISDRGPSISISPSLPSSLKTKRVSVSNNSRRRQQYVPQRPLIHPLQSLSPGRSRSLHSTCESLSKRFVGDRKNGRIRILPVPGPAIPHRNCTCSSPDCPAIKTDVLQRPWRDPTALKACACVVRRSRTN
jgi:hypothetical protein